jgi:hypothetical protein
MKIGDKIRLVSVPSCVKDDAEFKTRTILTKCLGHTFTGRGFQADGGRDRKRFHPGCWIELDIGEVIRGSRDTIWVEPGTVELLAARKKLRVRRKT